MTSLKDNERSRPAGARSTRVAATPKGKSSAAKGQPKSAPAGGASMSAMSTNAIRSSFLDFFAKNDHVVMPSSPLVPRHDPTLMFTNAGMVQFKNVFTGAEPPPHPRAATAQKCVRAGGKHNDLDNVGYTARHHTFFEMLGNFSFGDYFKERAILLAWELLTRDFALAKERLLITVFAEDEEAARLWRKIAGLPDERISASPAPTISGPWAIPAPADPARRFSTTMGRTSPAARPAVRTPRATASSRSGTSSSCNMSSTRAGSACLCRIPPSTPAWESSASPPSCKAPTTITPSTCSGR